jgi:hypothetical protein
MSGLKFELTYLNETFLYQGWQHSTRDLTQLTRLLTQWTSPEQRYNVLGVLYQSCFTRACIYSAGIAGEREVFYDVHAVFGVPSLKCSKHILHTYVYL